MADFRRNNHSGNNRNFGKPRFNRERSEMFRATCANCGKECEVPFRPTGNKPVLCRDCFKNNRGTDSYRSEQRVSDRPRFDNDSNQNRPNYQAQFDEINIKLDKILSLLIPNQTDSTPLESKISDETLNEIADEIQESNEKSSTKKEKKAKTKKSSAKKNNTN